MIIDNRTQRLLFNGSQSPWASHSAETHLPAAPHTSDYADSYCYSSVVDDGHDPLQLVGVCALDKR